MQPPFVGCNEHHPIGPGVVLFDAAWEHHAHVQVKESMGGKAGLGSLVATDADIGAQFVQIVRYDVRWTSPPSSWFTNWNCPNSAGFSVSVR